jgi:hypothetical protein
MIKHLELASISTALSVMSGVAALEVRGPGVVIDADFMAALTHSAMRTSFAQDSNGDEAEREDTAVEGPDKPTEGAAS